MLVPLILCCTSLLVFIVYNIVLLAKFKIPSSLSVSFYLYNGIKQNLGYVFTGFMFLMAFLLLPGWLEVGEVATSWSKYLQPIAFFGAAAIVFVGAAPAFRSCPLESNVHSIAAKVAAACSLLWSFTAGWQIMYVPIIACIPVVIIASATKTWKSGLTYWLEMMAFDATFATIITECAIHL